MPIFQNSFVTKQLQSQDKSKLAASWNVFKNHFHNLTIQDNIRSSKEEQYQGEFLIDLFVNVLGYTKNPTPNFTLSLETEWEVYFITEANKANPIKTQTNVSYIAIDVMVYELCSLSKE